MQVKYIGTCNKHDSIRGVGLHWTPGQVRSVTPEVAERLLHHTDTWQEVGSNDTDSQPIGLAQEEKPAEEPLPVVDFHSMDKKSMIEYAEKNYNQRISNKLTENNVRHKLVAMFTQHESEA